MAVIKVFPQQDSTIYSSQPNQNIGLDEILETVLLSGAVNPPNTSRILIQFANSDIQNIINTYIGTGSFSSNLRLFIADASGLNTSTYLQCYPISGAWDMGTGRKSDNPQTTDGVSWTWQTYNGDQQWATSSFNLNATASYSGSSNGGGGTWYYKNTVSSSYLVTQSFNYPLSTDVNMDVTTIVTDWISGSISNNGFILLLNNEFNTNTSVQPSMQWFSRDTHTIYPPCLEIKWRDFIWNTGSIITGSSNGCNSTPTTYPLQVINTNQLTVTLEQNPGIFYPDSINQFRVYSRPTYPARVYQTASLYTTNWFLPSASYYSVVDLDTNETIIDFDDSFTQLSADPTSSYFTLFCSGLEPLRNYQILIKTIINGTTLILDNDYYFKVINY